MSLTSSLLSNHPLTLHTFSALLCRCSYFSCIPSGVLRDGLTQARGPVHHCLCSQGNPAGTYGPCESTMELHVWRWGRRLDYGDPKLTFSKNPWLITSSLIGPVQKNSNETVYNSQFNTVDVVSQLDLQSVMSAHPSLPVPTTPQHGTSGNQGSKSHGDL
jgi:hypothetical protein